MNVLRTLINKILPLNTHYYELNLLEIMNFINLCVSYCLFNELPQFMIYNFPIVLKK